MQDRPALLIANDHSRRGGDIAPFAAALEQGGMTIRREACERAAAVSERIMAVKDEVSCVILGGGDGTMHAAAPALLESGLTLGILPLGTANDLSRSLGVPSDPAGAAATILGGRTRVIDLGTVNGLPFFNVASLGLGVGITRRLNRIMKRRFGALAYPLAAAITVATTGRFHAWLRADGDEVLAMTLQIAVGNGRFYGGGAVVDESAQIDDGLLHVYSLEPRARWRLMLLARAFRAGEHRTLREVRNFTCRGLSVTTRRSREVAADGEMVTRTPAHFGLLPGAVTVFVP